MESTTPNATPIPIPAFAPLERLDSVLWLLLVLVLVLILVLVLSVVSVAPAALMVAKSRPAIVGNAALGSIGQYELIDAGQEGVDNVDGGSVFVLIEDHWLFRAL